MSANNFIEIIEFEKKFYAYERQRGNEDKGYEDYEGILVFEVNDLREAIKKVNAYVIDNYVEYGYCIILEDD